MVHVTHDMDHVKTHGHEREGKKVRGSFLSLGIRPTRWEKKKKFGEMKTKKEEKNKKKEKKRERSEKKWEEENQAMGGGGVTPWEREKKEKGERETGFSWCSDSRSSIVRELKLVHATRAMCGYRNPNFSSKLQEVRVFSYTGSFSLKGRIV